MYLLSTKTRAKSLKVEGEGKTKEHLQATFEVWETPDLAGEQNLFNISLVVSDGETEKVQLTVCRDYLCYSVGNSQEVKIVALNELLTKDPSASVHEPARLGVKRVMCTPRRLKCDSADLSLRQPTERHYQMLKIDLTDKKKKGKEVEKHLLQIRDHKTNDDLLYDVADQTHPILLKIPLSRDEHGISASHEDESFDITSKSVAFRTDQHEIYLCAG